MSAQKYSVARLPRSTSASRFSAFLFLKKPRPTSHTLQFMNHEEGFLNSRDAQKLSAQAPSLDHCPSSGDVSFIRSPKSSPGLGFTGAGVFLRPSSSVPASSSVFSYCAPRPNIATDKSWGRSPKPPRSQGILGAGVFLPRCSEFRNSLPRFILGNPRPAAQRCKPLITQQVPEAPTGLRHPGRRRLPSSALLLLGPPFAFHFPLAAPQRPTLRAMDRGVGSQNAT